MLRAGVMSTLPTFAQSEVIKRVAEVKLRILLEAVPPEPRLGQLVVLGIDGLDVLADADLLFSILISVLFSLRSIRN